MASVSTPGVWPTAMPLHVNKKNVGKSYLEKKALKQIVKGHNKSIISPLHGTLLHCMIFPVLYQVSKQPIRRVIFSRDKSPPIFYFFYLWSEALKECNVLPEKHNTVIMQAKPNPGFLIQHPTSLKYVQYVILSPFCGFWYTDVIITNWHCANNFKLRTCNGFYKKRQTEEGHH